MSISNTKSLGIKFFALLFLVGVGILFFLKSDKIAELNDEETGVFKSAERPAKIQRQPEDETVTVLDRDGNPRKIKQSSLSIGNDPFRGVVGWRWKGHFIDKMPLSIVKKVEDNVTQLLQSHPVKGTPLDTNLLKYEAFDRAVKSELPEFDQDELVYCETEDFFLLWHIDDSRMRKGAALRRSDGTAIRWNLK